MSASPSKPDAATPRRGGGLAWRLWAECTFAWVDPLFRIGGAVTAGDLPGLEPSDQAAVMAAGARRALRACHGDMHSFGYALADAVLCIS